MRNTALARIRAGAAALATLSVLALGSPVTLRAAAHPLPLNAPDTHLGVTTCAGSTCHGAVRPFKNSNVLQNEFVTWKKEDAHAEAYKVLLNDDSKRIARNLGLRNAHEADICLDCHADNVPSSKRGKRFQLSDGVGCEACHGGAKRYLGPHVDDPGHQKNIALGMYPTDDPVARARLCLSCHFGDKSRLVTHRIMGAGHPRLSFELDTFTAIQPAHYEIDADYGKRKKVYQGVQVWAIGQAQAVNKSLDALLDPQRQEGLFPELVLFDCQACHHPLDDIRWQPRATTGLGPGLVRLNDANLLMLYHAVNGISPELATNLRNATLALHKATTKGHEETLRAARELQRITQSIEDQLAKHQFSATDVRRMLEGVVAEGSKGEFFDYSAAEQSVMAISSLLNTLERTGAIKTRSGGPINTALDALYASLEDKNQFRPATFASKMKEFQATLG